MKRGRQSFDPEMIEGPVYACGDIHGRLDLFEKFLAWVAEDAQSLVSVVFLGDYVDRGPDSRQIIEKLLAGPSRSNETWYPIKGNHDDLMVSAWKHPSSTHFENWMFVGGYNTIRSYGVSDIRDIPEAHIHFLDNLALGYDDGERLYVHAGVRPGVSMPSQVAHDLLWIREPFLSEAPAFDRIIVHGHTPTAFPAVLPYRVGLDIGAYKTGNLAGARFDPLRSDARLWIGTESEAE